MSTTIYILYILRILFINVFVFYRTGLRDALILFLWGFIIGKKYVLLTNMLFRLFKIHELLILYMALYLFSVQTVMNYLISCHWEFFFFFYRQVHLINKVHEQSKYDWNYIYYDIVLVEHRKTRDINVYLNIRHENPLIKITKRMKDFFKQMY